MIKINDVELEELDLLDADVAEKYEIALKRILEIEENPGEQLSLSSQIRKECTQVFNFFDDLYGEGTSKKIFGEKTNLRECTCVFAEFIHSMEKYAKDIKKDLKKISIKAVK